MIASQLELHRLNTNRIVPVATACRLLKQFLFRYQGHIGAALILGGVDNTGPHLHTIYPHGSVDTLPFVTMGSGSLAAMSIFESRWRPNMDVSITFLFRVLLTLLSIKYIVLKRCIKIQFP